MIGQLDAREVVRTTAYCCLLFEELPWSPIQRRAPHRMSWRATSSHRESWSRADCQSMLSGDLCRTGQSFADRLVYSVGEFQSWGRRHRRKRRGVLQKSVKWLAGLMGKKKKRERDYDGRRRSGKEIMMCKKKREEIEMWYTFATDRKES